MFFVVLGAFIALLLIIAFASDQRDRRQGREVPTAAELRLRVRGAKRKAREDRRRLRLPSAREVDNVTLNSRAEPPLGSADRRISRPLGSVDRSDQ